MSTNGITLLHSSGKFYSTFNVDTTVKYQAFLYSYNEIGNSTLESVQIPSYKGKYKATVEYRCSKVINRLRENKSGLQTKTQGNTSTLRGKQRNNRNTEFQHKHTND